MRYGLSRGGLPLQVLEGQKIASLHKSLCLYLKEKALIVFSLLMLQKGCFGTLGPSPWIPLEEI